MKNFNQSEKLGIVRDIEIEQQEGSWSKTEEWWNHPCSISWMACLLMLCPSPEKSSVLVEMWFYL